MRAKKVFGAQCSVSDNPSDKGHAARSTLTFTNRQRDRRLNLPFLRRVLHHLLAGQLPAPTHDLCFHFVTAEEMARVNRQFLQHEGSTDVITFDHSQPTAPSPDPRPQTPDPLSGEAFICVADAVKQAREFKTSWQSEVVRYAIHAVLHLRGYDDLQPAKRRVMKREENRVLKQTALRFVLSSLVGVRKS